MTLFIIELKNENIFKVFNFNLNFKSIEAKEKLFHQISLYRKLKMIAQVNAETVSLLERIFHLKHVNKNCYYFKKYKTRSLKKINKLFLVFLFGRKISENLKFVLTFHYFLLNIFVKY